MLTLRLGLGSTSEDTCNDGTVTPSLESAGDVCRFCSGNALELCIGNMFSCDNILALGTGVGTLGFGSDCALKFTLGSSDGTLGLGKGLLGLGSGK